MARIKKCYIGSRSQNEKTKANALGKLSKEDANFTQSLKLDESEYLVDDNSHSTTMLRWQKYGRKSTHISREGASPVSSEYVPVMEVGPAYEHSDSITVISDCVQSRASAKSAARIPLKISRPQQTRSTFNQQEKLVAIQSQKKRPRCAVTVNGRRDELGPQNHLSGIPELPAWALDLGDDSSMDKTYYSKQSSKTMEILSKQLRDLRTDTTHNSFLLEASQNVDSSLTCSQCPSSPAFTSSNKFTMKVQSSDLESPHSNSSTDAACSEVNGSSTLCFYSGALRGTSKVRRKVPVSRIDSGYMDMDDNITTGGTARTAPTNTHPRSEAHLKFNARSNFMEGKRPPTSIPSNNDLTNTASSSSFSMGWGEPRLTLTSATSSLALIDGQPSSSLPPAVHQDSTAQGRGGSAHMLGLDSHRAGVLELAHSVDSMHVMPPNMMPSKAVAVEPHPQTPNQATPPTQVVLPAVQVAPLQQSRTKKSGALKGTEDLDFLLTNMASALWSQKLAGSTNTRGSLSPSMAVAHKNDKEEAIVLYQTEPRYEGGKEKDERSTETSAAKATNTKVSASTPKSSPRTEPHVAITDDKIDSMLAFLNTNLDEEARQKISSPASVQSRTKANDPIQWVQRGTTNAVTPFTIWQESAPVSANVTTEPKYLSRQVPNAISAEDGMQPTDSPKVESHGIIINNGMQLTDPLNVDNAAGNGMQLRDPPKAESIANMSDNGMQPTDPSTGASASLPTFDRRTIATPKRHSLPPPRPKRKQEGESTFLPELHLALQRGASLTEIYQVAAAAKADDPSVLRFRDEQGNTPLHLACMVPGQKEAATTVQWWNPIKTTKSTIGNKAVMAQRGLKRLTKGLPNTPPHPYYDGDSLVLVIQLLYNLCPENIERANRHGDLPLHLAIQSATATLKTWASDNQANSVLSHGETTRHNHDATSDRSIFGGNSTTRTMTTSKMWTEIIGKMIFEYPKALHLPNKKGQVPLDLAIHKMGTCPEIVSLLQEEIGLLGDNFSDYRSDESTQFTSSTEQNWCRSFLHGASLPSISAQQQMLPVHDRNSNVPASSSPTIQSFANAQPNTPILHHDAVSASSRFPLLCPWHSFLFSTNNAIWQIADSRATFIITALFVFASLAILPCASTDHYIRVAFIGNSITFVNDLPRMMEALSEGHISQNSCLHGATRLRTILSTGNGMYNKWQTENAFLKEITMGDDLYQYVRQDDDAAVYGESHTIYDFGACTVEQLLFGTDEYLYAYNENEYYTNDGKNACFQDAAYFRYQQQRYLEMARAQRQEQEEEPDTLLQLWDFVVLNDQTLVPAIYEERKMSEEVLTYVYAPYFEQINARPVLLMTHAYSINASVNFDDDLLDLWEDVPMFSSALHQGYLRYRNALSRALPAHQEPLFAPAGLAFLVIWEDNFTMWERLFYSDGFHPTPHGTFLIGCVLYATLYDKMPASIPKDIEKLFSRARRMAIASEDDEPIMPTHEEAIYLAKVAERVVLKQYMPKSYVENVLIDY